MVTGITSSTSGRTGITRQGTAARLRASRRSDSSRTNPIKVGVISGYQGPLFAEKDIYFLAVPIPGLK